MAEEFVDLYEVLKLPVDTDRNTVRKRINELYLDAQRNLDHRNFATRVQFQEMFEVILPQARYILLDDGRRDEYNRIVMAFRSAKDGTIPNPSAQKSSFSLEPQPDPSIPGERAIEPLPPVAIDPEQLAREREELWSKWKSGLEEALGAEKAREDAPKPRSATTSSPSPSSPSSPSSSSGFSTATQSASGATAAPASVQAKTQPVTPATPKPAARPKVNIAFDFAEKETPTEIASAASEMDHHGHPPVTTEEVEARRTEHRRQMMKEVLVNVGLVWACVGAAIVLVPGVIGLITFVGKNYPRQGAPHIKAVGANVVWIGGFVVLGALAYVVGQQLSKMMRRNKAKELSFLSYEDLMKRVGKS